MAIEAVTAGLAGILSISFPKATSLSVYRSRLINSAKPLQLMPPKTADRPDSPSTLAKRNHQAKRTIALGTRFSKAV